MILKCICTAKGSTLTGLCNPKSVFEENQAEKQGPGLCPSSDVWCNQVTHQHAGKAKLEEVGCPVESTTTFWVTPHPRCLPCRGRRYSNNTTRICFPMYRREKKPLLRRHHNYLGLDFWKMLLTPETGGSHWRGWMKSLPSKGFHKALTSRVSGHWSYRPRQSCTKATYIRKPATKALNNNQFLCTIVRWLKETVICEPLGNDSSAWNKNYKLVGHF